MDWVSLILRIGLGIIFMAHGSQKAFSSFGGSGVTGFASMLTNLGFKPAIFWAYLAAYIELLGGFCLICGLFVRYAAFFLMALIMIAAFKVHLAKGFFLANGGFEYTFLIVAVCLALIILGPGKFSLMKKF